MLSSPVLLVHVAALTPPGMPPAPRAADGPVTRRRFSPDGPASSACVGVSSAAVWKVELMARDGVGTTSAFASGRMNSRLQRRKVGLRRLIRPQSAKADFVSWLPWFQPPGVGGAAVVI